MAENPREIAEYQSDHDLIVRVDERTLTISENIEKLSYALQRKTDDHETRLRATETAVTEIKASSRAWRYILSFAIAITTIASTIISAIIASHRL
jgi:hypothetical protein